MPITLHSTAVTPRRPILRALCALAGLLLAAAAPAADWRPEKPIEIVVGITAGGPGDVTARLLQRVLQDRRMVPVPVSVSNRTGGNHAIAWTYLNQHAGDGHVLAITLPNIVTNRLLGAHPLSYLDVTPLAQLNSEAIVFSVKADSAIRTGADLVQRLRANPQAASIAFSNIGSANHLGAGIAMKAAGVDVKKLKIVAFKGASEAVTALLGGHVDVVASSASTVAPHAQSGSLRLVATASPRRLPAYPAVPTWTEQGVPASFANWRGIIGPKGMTAAQVAYWDDLLGRVVKSEEWAKEVAQRGWEADYANAADSRRFLEQQNDALRAVLADLGLAR